MVTLKNFTHKLEAGLNLSNVIFPSNLDGAQTVFTLIGLSTHPSKSEYSNISTALVPNPYARELTFSRKTHLSTNMEISSICQIPDTCKELNSSPRTFVTLFLFVLLKDYRVSWQQLV